MDTTANKRYHILVSGKVQGVGFRYFTRDVAASLSLGGWVRNLRNGGVEIEAEGNMGDIDRLIDKLRQGPPLSRVADVTLQEMVPLDVVGDFIIR